MRAESALADCVPWRVWRTLLSLTRGRTLQRAASAARSPAVGRFQSQRADLRNATLRLASWHQ